MLAIDKNSWDEMITHSKGWVLVDFWGPRCAPCLKLMPEIEKLALKYKDKMPFYSLDTSKAMRLAMAQGVMSLPVVAFYQNGNKKEELSGDFNEKDVEEMILKLIK